MTKIAIIGSGPAGLFCADRLAGYADVTIYEAGLPIEKRACSESSCNKCRICHVLEGEGGAGGLSDGKNTYSLSRGTQMENIFHSEEGKWLSEIDAAMVRFAGQGVWYEPLREPPEAFKGSPLKFESYPLRHVGSDGIRRFIRGFVDDLVSRGVAIEYGQRVSPCIDPHKRARGVAVLGDHYPSDVVVIAAGLQGIQWIENLMREIGSPLRSGPAGFGLRLETDASVLANLHRLFYDYKIIYEYPDEPMTIRSFCCNQNGYVLNERHTDMNIVSVNGHSYLDPRRRTASSNVAIMAKILGSTYPPYLSPQNFVRATAYSISRSFGGSVYQPVMEFMDKGNEFDDSFMTNKQSRRAPISRLLPYSLIDAFRSFLGELHHLAPVISPKSIIYAPEIKYYGRRVNVTPRWRCKDAEGLYIIGSGSGYLDSVVAAALSGIIAAEDIKVEVL